MTLELLKQEVMILSGIYHYFCFVSKAIYVGETKNIISATKYKYFPPKELCVPIMLAQKIVCEFLAYD